MDILIIEDEALIAFWISTLIEDAGHRSVGSCKTLEEAKRLADASPPEMALVDLRLGNKRCGATIDAYLAETFGTTSIYLTANSAFALSYRRRAIGFLEKPIERDDVLEVVDFVYHIRQGRAAPTPRRLHLFEALHLGTRRSVFS